MSNNLTNNKNGAYLQPTVANAGGPDASRIVEALHGDPIAHSYQRYRGLAGACARTQGRSGIFCRRVRGSDLRRFYRRIPCRADAVIMHADAEAVPCRHRNPQLPPDLDRLERGTCHHRGRDGDSRARTHVGRRQPRLRGHSRSHRPAAIVPADLRERHEPGRGHGKFTLPPPGGSDRDVPPRTRQEIREACPGTARTGRLGRTAG
jgi:hypothetical protein